MMADYLLVRYEEIDRKSYEHVLVEIEIKQVQLNFTSLIPYLIT